MVGRSRVLGAGAAATSPLTSAPEPWDGRCTGEHHGKGPILLSRLRARLTYVRAMRIQTLWMAAALAVLLIPTAAHGATMGPRGFAGPSIFTQSCGVTGPCTWANAKLPEGRARSPIDGVISRWEIRVTGSGAVSPQVLRRTVNQPGVVNDAFKAVREGTQQTITSDGTYGFAENLRIREGDFLGVRVEGASLGIRGITDGFSRYLGFYPPLTPGAGSDTATAPGLAGDNLLIKARVRE